MSNFYPPRSRIITPDTLLGRKGIWGLVAQRHSSALVEQVQYRTGAGASAGASAGRVPVLKRVPDLRANPCYVPVPTFFMLPNCLPRSMLVLVNHQCVRPVRPVELWYYTSTVRESWKSWKSWPPFSFSFLLNFSHRKGFQVHIFPTFFHRRLPSSLI